MLGQEWCGVSTGPGSAVDHSVWSSSNNDRAVCYQVDQDNTISSINLSMSAINGSPAMLQAVQGNSTILCTAECQIPVFVYDFARLRWPSYAGPSPRTGSANFTCRDGTWMGRLVCEDRALLDPDSNSSNAASVVGIGFAFVNGTPGIVCNNGGQDRHLDLEDIRSYAECQKRCRNFRRLCFGINYSSENQTCTIQFDHCTSYGPGSGVERTLLAGTEAIWLSDGRYYAMASSITQWGGAVQAASKASYHGIQGSMPSIITAEANNILAEISLYVQQTSRCTTDQIAFPNLCKTLGSAWLPLRNVKEPVNDRTFARTPGLEAFGELLPSVYFYNDEPSWVWIDGEARGQEAWFGTCEMCCPCCDIQPWAAPSGGRDILQCGTLSGDGFSPNNLFTNWYNGTAPTGEGAMYSSYQPSATSPCVYMDTMEDSYGFWKTVECNRRLRSNDTISIERLVIVEFLGHEASEAAASTATTVSATDATSTTISSTMDVEDYKPSTSWSACGSEPLCMCLPPMHNLNWTNFRIPSSAALAIYDAGVWFALFPMTIGCNGLDLTEIPTLMDVESDFNPSSDNESLLIRLDHNRLTDNSISASTFAHIINLRELDLSYNRLLSVPYFRHSHLEILRLSGNPLLLLPPGSLKDLPMLQEIYMDDVTTLKAIGAGFFYQRTNPLLNLVIMRKTGVVAISPFAFDKQLPTSLSGISNPIEAQFLIADSPSNCFGQVDDAGNYQPVCECSEGHLGTSPQEYPGGSFVFGSRAGCLHASTMSACGLAFDSILQDSLGAVVRLYCDVNPLPSTNGSLSAPFPSEGGSMCMVCSMHADHWQHSGSACSSPCNQFDSNNDCAVSLGSVSNYGNLPCVDPPVVNTFTTSVSPALSTASDSDSTPVVVGIVVALIMIALVFGAVSFVRRSRQRQLEQKQEGMWKDLLERAEELSLQHLVSFNRHLLEAKGQDLDPVYSCRNAASKVSSVRLSDPSTITMGIVTHETSNTIAYDGKINDQVVSLFYPKKSDRGALGSHLADAKLLFQLEHQNIISIVGIVDNQMPVMYATEKLDYTLKQFLKGLRCAMDSHEIDLTSIASQFISGCEHLETNGVVHGQLAAENVFVSSTGKIVKLAYFMDVMQHGLVSVGAVQSSTTSFGPVRYHERLRWMAPELISSKETVPTIKSDVWAAGVVLWEIFSYGQRPFGLFSAPEVKSCIESGDMLAPPPNCSKRLFALLRSTWKSNPKSRTTFSNLAGVLRLLEIPDGEAMLYEQELALKPLEGSHLLSRARTLAGACAKAAAIQEVESKGPKSVPEIDSECLKPIRMLGAGEFGTVELMLLHADRSSSPPKCSLIAAKVLRDSTDPSALTDELEVMMKVSSTYVISAIGAVRKSSPNIIAMEYLAGGSLDNWLTLNQSTLQDWHCAHILCEIALGMNAVATAGIVHRDLAARNVLIGTDMRVKVADLGLSRVFSTSDYYRLQSCGMVALRWTAPECMKNKKWNTASDIFAYGVTVSEIFSRGEEPFPDILEDHKLVQLFTQSTNEAIVDHLRFSVDGLRCNSFAKKVAQLCLDRDASKRPSFLDVAKHFSRIVVECSSDTSDNGYLEIADDVIDGTSILDGEKQNSPAKHLKFGTINSTGV